MTEPIFKAKVLCKDMDGLFLTGTTVAQVLLFLAVFHATVCKNLTSEYAYHAILNELKNRR